MMLSPEKLAELEFESCQQEKRDRMNARLQVWSLLIGLVGAFGLVSVQGGAIAYVAALYPLLAACIARYSGHSEAVLEQLKAYLHELEERASYRGYEYFNRASKRRGVGNHARALRDAILLTDVLAVAVVALRLIQDQQILLAVVLVLMEVIAAALTWRWLCGGYGGR